MDDDPVRAAVDRVRRSARPGTGRRRDRRRADPDGTRRSGYSGAGPDERDPAPVGDVAGALFSERGWERPLAEARVFADWPALVGPDVARRASPTGLLDGHLRLAAESTAWATQLRLLAPTILARLAAELGPGVVTRVSITGPAAPSWRHGPRAVPGARGPRDTFG